mmetsp:Transcript_35330/g.110437  ORF Transcript_35330/g.110437 Transcript_35330/m.110437 type:complete len:108 (+) Transcript_35330:4484-4807(+)
MDSVTSIPAIRSNLRSRERETANTGQVTIMPVTFVKQASRKQPKAKQKQPVMIRCLSLILNVAERYGIMNAECNAAIAAVVEFKTPRKVLPFPREGTKVLRPTLFHD